MSAIIDMDAIDITHKHIIFFTASYTFSLNVLAPEKKQANVTK
jgi:hypothetical protein